MEHILNSKDAKETETMTFEDALKELEIVVRKIEDKQTTLDEAIDLFKRGSKLSQVCERKLTDAQIRIKQLVGDKEVDFTVPSND